MGTVRTPNFGFIPNQILWKFFTLLIVLQIFGIQSNYAKIFNDKDLVFDDLPDTKLNDTKDTVLTISKNEQTTDFSNLENRIRLTDELLNVYDDDVLSDINNDNEGELIDDNENWLSRGVRRVRRELNRFLGGDKEQISNKKHKNANELKLKKKRNNNHTSTKNQHKKNHLNHLKKNHNNKKKVSDSNEKLGNMNRSKRQWFSNLFGGSEKDDDKDDDLDDDDHDDDLSEEEGHLIDASGDHPTDENDESLNDVQFYRIKFIAREMWVNEYLDHRSDAFMSFSNQLNIGIKRVFHEIEDDEESAEVTSIVVEMAQTTDLFKIHITADLKVKGYHYGNIETVIKDEISTVSMLGDVPAQMDNHFSVRLIRAADYDNYSPPEGEVYEVYEDNSTVTHPHETRPTDSRPTDGTSCDTNEFTCNNGECIYSGRYCDGIRDCLDNSDEENCATPVHEQDTSVIPEGSSTSFDNAPPHRNSGDTEPEILPDGSGEGMVSTESTELNGCRGDDIYRCELSNKIICEVQKCDGHQDCPDGEDERDCQDTTTSKETATGCRSDEFSCTDGSACIELNRKCDSFDDCYDGSDEHDCPVVCERNEFLCDNNTICVQNDRKCDNYNDCKDGTDERDCHEVCGDDQFSCTEIPQCIPMSGLCNRYRDCEDGSDEKNCEENNGCENDEFTCDNGECILLSERCDKNIDCIDGTDEIDCPKRCEVDEFTCDNGECISMSEKCDNNIDCRDGTDEIDCKKKCESDEYTCDSGECIPLSEKCDSNIDCRDGTDELDCPKRCNTDEFSCDNGECIPLSEKCDSNIDCRDGTDELDCPKTCGHHEFTCDNGECIQLSQRCDRNIDCRDGTDEIDCGVCRSDEFACESDNLCLPLYKKCDKNIDCRDGTDEIDCYPNCRQDEYQCSSGKCIPRNLICNKHNDCENGDDEERCDGDHYCGHDEFHCDDGCKPNYLKCDGNRDCMDGIDEYNCSITRPTEPTRPYQCPELTCPGTNKCYLYSERCDGIPDCDDRSDEHSCCRADQITCTDGSCAVKCNGVPECRDSSDEWNCPTHGCQPYQWRCDDGQCINQYDKCNGRSDCRDYSDERNCPHPPTDAPRLHLKTYPSSQIIKESREVVFRCRDEGPIRAAVRWTRPGGRPLPIGAVDKQGRLEIPNIRVEDAGDYVCEAIGYPSYTTGQNVLVNLVVEKYRPPTRPTACQYHEATCMNGECIDKKQICDGIHNCADGSDEHSCSHGRKCNPNQFLCKNSKCVDRIWRCDGENDCGDNSDEESCDPNPSNAPCRHDEYQCRSGHCVPKSFHCDGTNDCQDGSDEIGCTPPAVITPPPPRVNLEIGQTLNISCRATGVPVPVIVFRLNWGHVPDKCVITSYGGYGTLYCPDMQVIDSGAYSCEIINIKGVIFVTPDTIVTVDDRSPKDCVKGYFNKFAVRPEECIQCFCFGVTNQCNSADLYTYALPAPITSHKVVGVEIPPYGEITISDYTDHDLISLRHGVQFRVSNIPYSRQQPYLELPQEYKGSQLKSYGGYLKYNVQYIGNGRPITSPDIIMIGNGYTLTHHSRTPIESNTQNEISVRFVPGNWKKSNNRDATREEIMMVLAGVESILIRLEYIDATEREVELTHITMDSAGIYDLGLGSASLVEQCSCPTGYTGFSCESCAPGYSRQIGGPWLGRCVKITIKICNDGQYGDESRGIRCRDCPCPLTNPTNNFARGCSLSSDDDVQCNCNAGYIGRRCEQCAPGYDGDPMTIGCHIRPVSTCDPYGTAYTRPDGSCECKAHVVGALCNMCAPNSFHLNHFTYTGCIDCFCMGVAKTCSSSTWYRDRIQSDFSRRSDYSRSRIQHGFQLVANYEVPIPSDVLIEEYNNQLVLSNPSDSTEVLYWSLPIQFLGDKVTAYGGNLSYVLRYNPMPGGLMSRNVAPDVVLKSANDIVILHYRKNDMLPSINQNYSIPIIENSWQRSDGITINREHLLMALADVEAILIKATYTTVTAEASLSLVSLDTAAVRSSIGSTRRAVEVEQCSCPVGYLGLSCQDCAPGYKRSIDQGLYLGLCEQCECNGHSNECDSETGICLNCRDNTEGEQCERCASGYYGNATSGDCAGSHGCQNCDERGTIDCRNNQCLCKNNVVGAFCDQCRHGSFNLNMSNSHGCSECFCSGLSESCHRANLYKQLIPLAFIDNTPVISDIDGNVLDLNVDIDLSENKAIYRTESRTQKYWSLSSNQLGNRIKSYGGYLEFEQNVESYQNYVPAEDIILFGNGIKISWTRPSHLENQPQVHVRLHEDEEWYRQDRESRHRASRIDIMQVLANVDHILIRATTKIPTISTSLSNIVLETAEHGGRYGLTVGDVEICQCPVGYDGSSCESCSPLYYRNITNTQHGFFGSCLPCPCGEETESCEMQNHMNGNVVCHCKVGYSGDRCQYPDGGPILPPIQPVHPEAKISVRIITPSINIINIGGSITLKCSALVIDTREPLPIRWYKLNDELPRGAIITPDELYLQNLHVHDSGIYVCVAEHNRERVEEMYRLNVGNSGSSRPIVTIEPPVHDVEEYQSVEVYCQATGDPKPDIIWTKVDGPLSSNIQIIDDRLYIESALKSDEGIYSCVARNDIGRDSRNVTIYVHPRVIHDLVYIEPSLYEGKPGDTVRLNCQLRSSITVEYEWLKDNNHLYGNRNLDINNNILTIRDASIQDSGVYECRIIDIDTSQTYTSTSQVYIRRPNPVVDQRPTVTPLQPKYQVIQGSDLTISCIAFSKQTPRIHWTRVHESMDSNVQTYDNILRIVNAQPSNRGEYICVAENPSGSDQSTTYIDVEPRERPAIEIYPHESQNVHIGQSIQLNCRIIGGIPQPRITWRRTDGRPFSSRITLHHHEGILMINDIQLEDTGSYECEAENSIGRTTASSSVIIAELPYIELIPDETELVLTVGEPLSINCKAFGSPLPSVEWDNDNRQHLPAVYAAPTRVAANPSALMFISRVTQSDSKVYTCTASNSIGSVHKYVNVRVKQGRGDTDIDETGQPSTPRSRNFFAEIGDDAKISCDVENDDRRQMRTHWERLDGRPLPPYSRIEGTNLIINRVNHDSVGVYRCNIIDINNGIPLAYFDANLILLNLPHITLSPEMPMTVSQGQTVDIFCNATGERPIDIEWHAENNRQLPPTVRAEGPYLRFHAIRFGDAGRYFCTASNRYGNATKVAEVVVNHSTTTHDRPQVARTQEINEGQDVVLDCDIDSGYIRPGTRYVWRRNGSSISPYAVQEHNRLILRQVRIDDEGDYTCEIVSPSGTVAKSSVQLIIKREYRHRF